MPVKFVPEMARLVSLLSSFHLDHVSEAVVVDEWGGTEASSRGRLRELSASFASRTRRRSGDRGRGGGTLPRERRPVGARVERGLQRRRRPLAFETVGGFVSAAPGDPARRRQVHLGAGLVGVVDEVRGHRVVTLTLQSRSEDRVVTRGGAAGARPGSNG